MNRIIALAGAALIASTTLPVLAPSVLAQGQPQSLAVLRIDPVTLRTGYRASKVNGAAVVNETGDRIGTIDDIIISQDGKSPYAVLSIGGFLGMGERLVALPYSQLAMAENKIILRGATKDTLKALPEYKYNN